MLACSLIENTPGLWWAVITATIAAVLLGRASWHGPFPPMAGMIATAGLSFIAISYWWEMTGNLAAAAEIRRAAAWILWPSLAYSLGTLIRSTYLLDH